MKEALLDVLFRNRGQFGDVVPKSLLRKPHQELNLSEETIAYFRAHPELSFNPRDIINPHRCANLVKQILKVKRLVWCYGGWLEDRSALLQASYLKKERRFIHLGIDIVLPINTPVLTALNGKVHLSDTDYPEKGGWGNYIVLKHQLDGITFYSITGHLDNRSRLGEGRRVARGDIIGWVGNQVENGFWFPHTHFQFVSETEMEKTQKPFTLDGYGAKEILEYLRQHYPDPLVCLPMADLPKKKAT